MKVQTILVFLYFCFLLANAQTQESQSKEEPTFLPNDEIELQEELKAVRDEIQKINQKIENWKRHKTHIEHNISELDGRTVNTDTIINSLDVSIQNGQNDTQIALENQLRNLIYQSFFPQMQNNMGFPGSPDFDYELDGVISNMNQKFQTSNSNVVNSALYQRLINYRADESPRLETSDISKLKDLFSSDKVNAKRKDVTAILKEHLKEIESKIASFEGILKELEKKRNDISKKADTLRTSINELAINLGLPLFCVTIVLLFLGPMLIRAFAKNSAETKAYSSSILLELITVLLLTMSVLILGLADKIAGEVLGTLLGGISGYVLNRIRTKKEIESAQNN